MEKHKDNSLNLSLRERVMTYQCVPLPQQWDKREKATESSQERGVVLSLADTGDATCAIEALSSAFELRAWTLTEGDKALGSDTSWVWEPSSADHDSPVPSVDIFTLAVGLTSDYGEEGYRIDIDELTHGITLYAGAPRGFFYGALTLAMLSETAQLSSTRAIQDAPHFEHRGFMFDVARSYQPLEVLKDIVDTAALLKYNTVHLHLVDDQGWRVEITNDGRKAHDHLDYTALHRVSGATAVNPGSDPGFDTGDATTGSNAVHDDTNRGYEAVPAGRPGYYTQAELKELVAYAARRHIRIVPELEFPGHNHSVLHALPELATEGAWTQAQDGVVPAWTRWQVGYSYLDFDNPATWDFAEHVMRQYAEIFGTHTLHVGADECYNLISHVGTQRYNEILSRVIELAHRVGFTHVSVWQEGVKALPSLGNENSTRTDRVQLWNYTDPAVVDELLTHVQQRNARIINSDGRRVYLDQKIDLDDSRGLTWAVAEGLPTRATYEWDPLASIPQDLHPYVAGIETCLWSETVRSVEDIAYLSLPRLASIAEVAWTAQEGRSWESIQERLGEPRHAFWGSDGASESGDMVSGE